MVRVQAEPFDPGAELNRFAAGRTDIGAVASFTGLLLSYQADVPTGPAVILCCGAFYFLSILVGVKGGIIWGLMPRKHLEA